MEKFFYAIFVVVLIFILHNGDSGLIPSILKPCLWILNLSLLLATFYRYKRSNSTTSIKQGLIFLITFFVFLFTAFLLPVFYLPTHSVYFEDHGPLHYYSTPQPYGSCIHVDCYKQHGIYLEYDNGFDCQPCSVEECLKSNI